MKNLLKLLVLAAATLIGGCSDYTIYSAETRTETETVYIEVPVYIYEEVPGDTEYGEIWVDHFYQPQKQDLI